MNQLKELLDFQVIKYNTPDFIQDDPISIPHLFTLKEDIEIAGFLTALLSWGNRTSILKSTKYLMVLFDFSPYQFVLNSGKNEILQTNRFYHRTFNGNDLLFLIYALRDVYQNHGGLESIAENGFLKNGQIKDSIISLRDTLCETPHLFRSEKHLANPAAGSAAKRINMFLRWMVRNDGQGVDFGLWKNIPQSQLMCPLDVHSGRVARKLGLLLRNQNDWKAVEELTGNLRVFDQNDPVKFDFALFGMGINA